METPEQPVQPQSPATPAMAPAAGMDITPTASEVTYPAYPLQFDVGYRQEYSRWLPLVKWLLAIPHWFVLTFVGIGAFFGIVAAWFMVLVTGRYPEGIFKFLVGAWRWSLRVMAYQLLLVDEYPPFSLDDDPDYPVRFNVDYPPEGKIARWRIFFAWVPVIPQLFIASWALFAAYIGIVVAFFSILFTKRFPRGIFDFVVNSMRFQNRAGAYAYWLTERYPGFAWG